VGWLFFVNGAHVPEHNVRVTCCGRKAEALARPGLSLGLCHICTVGPQESHFTCRPFSFFIGKVEQIRSAQLTSLWCCYDQKK
jgi:hypothetical protein